MIETYMQARYIIEQKKIYYVEIEAKITLCF